MEMVLAYEHAPRLYKTVVTSGVGISHKGEALTLLPCTRQLASQQGVFWVVSDSESVVGDCGCLVGRP